MLGLAACASSPSDLGRDDDASAGPSTATAGGAGAGGSGGAGAGGVGGGEAPPVEPDGPTTITIVNGLADAERAAICLLASPADPGDPASPLPAAGLEPGGSLRLESGTLPSSDVEVVLLAGPASAFGALSCRDVASDPSSVSELSVVSLGVLPESVFEARRSWLLGVTGCAMPDHVEPETLAACGPSYAFGFPDPSVVLAPMSRLADPGAVNLQTVHVSAPTLIYDWFVRTSFDGSAPVGIAQGVVQGQAAPFPPSTALVATDLSVNDAAFAIALPGEGITSLGETRIVNALERSGLGPNDWRNGANLVAVAVGAPPGVPPSTPFHPFTFVMIDPIF